MGFETHDDSLYDFFVKLIDEYCNKIEPDNDSVMKYTLKVYVELVNEKTRRVQESKI
jgi:hypothetical protein